MKILHVVASLDEKYGGPSILLPKLTIKQFESKNEIDIVTTHCSNEDLKFKKKFLNKGINLFIFKVFSKYRISLNLIFWLVRNLRNYNVIHIHGIYRFPVDITFICDEKLDVKEKMESWVDLITGNHRVAPNGELNDTKVFNPGYYNDYIGTIQILKLNETGQQVMDTTLIEAYPLSVSPLTLSWASAELQKLSVSFSYRYYRQTQPSSKLRRVNVQDRNFGSFGPVPEVPATGPRGLPSSF